MSSRVIRLIIMGGAVLFFCVAIITFIAYQRKPVASLTPEMAGAQVETDPDELLERDVSCFFFSDSSGLLQAVPKRLKSPGRPDQVYRAFLDLLLTGEPNLLIPLPAGAQVRALYFWAEKKRLVVDFEEGLQDRVLKGSTAELSLIYFFVNNFCFNFKEIESVQFLIGGNEREVLAGHIVFDEPFFPDFAYLSGRDE
jgi:hypothetical protein